MLRPSLVVILLGVLGIVCKGSEASLDMPWWQAGGGAAGDHLGSSVAGVPDLDGDGLGDVVIGVPDDDVGALTNAGSVQVRSGADGSLLWSASGDNTGDVFGTAVAGVPDLDGDGVADVVVGAPRDDAPGRADAGAAYAYSGADGTFLWVARGDTSGDLLGSAVAGVPDVNGDGRGDVAVGAPDDDAVGSTNAGSVCVLSGASGALVWKAFGGAFQDHAGASVAGVPDVTGDGRGDVVVGTPDDDVGALLDAGSIALRSGTDGSLVWTVLSATGSTRFGSALAHVPDLEGSGLPGVAVGANADDPSGRTNAGSVHAVSATTGDVLWSMDGVRANDTLGAAVGGGPDVDGDGVGEVFAGAPTARIGTLSAAGAAYVLSGSTGDVLWDTAGAAAGDSVGCAVSGVPDVDGDGLGDVVIGARGVDCGGLGDAGLVTVHATDEADSDVTAPAVVCPDDLVAEATGPDGATVTFTVTATDDMDPSPVVVCQPASGSTFPLGTTTVTCTATDATGNQSSCSFDVTVADTTAPEIVCPDDRVAEATGPGGATVTFTVTATDGVDPAPAVACVPASGSTFPLGTTTVACTVTDAAGNQSSCSFDVTVADTAAPTLVVDLGAGSLWPPNHSTEDVGLTFEATDTADADVEVTVRVLSDEAAAEGESDATLDGSSLSLRAARDGNGDGRVYLVLFTATDAAGNAATARATVVVPKSSSRANQESVAQQAEDAVAASESAEDGVPPGYVTVLPTTSVSD
jgi:hypothetical protein